MMEQTTMTKKQGMREELRKLKGQISKKEKRRVGLVKKTMQALVDKIEIMRDLATYEVNFSDAAKMPDRMD